MRTATALALIAFLFLGGCGGRHAADREVDSLSREFTSKTSPFGAPMQKDQARCVARVYLESDLDESSLEPLEHGRPVAPSNPAEAEKLSEISKKISEDCLST